ncbi:MAG: Hpt domain-containing protein [Pseudomonadota bacterium]
MSDLIDLNHLQLYVGDDVSLRDEILSIFEDQLALWMGRLSPDMDDDTWYQAAHTLKGAARGVGVWAIGDLCEKAEALMGPDAEPARADLLGQLGPLADRVTAALKDVATDAAA